MVNVGKVQQTILGGTWQTKVGGTRPLFYPGNGCSINLLYKSPQPPPSVLTYYHTVLVCRSLMSEYWEHGAFRLPVYTLYFPVYPEHTVMTRYNRTSSSERLKDQEDGTTQNFLPHLKLLVSVSVDQLIPIFYYSQNSEWNPKYVDGLVKGWRSSEEGNISPRNKVPP